MKHYDSYIYKQDKKFEAVIVIICAFLIRIYARLCMYRLCGK